MQFQRWLSHLFMTVALLNYAFLFHNPQNGNVFSVLVQAESVNEGSTSEPTTPKEENNTMNENVGDAQEEDWGSFYDPKGVFCGEFDCYKILGLDHYDKPTTKDITKNFRSLSRVWHPDKNRQKGAKDRFVVRFVLIPCFFQFCLVIIAHMYVFVLNRKSKKHMKFYPTKKNAKNMIIIVIDPMNIS